jgi:hypothetical protein
MQCESIGVASNNDLALLLHGADLTHRLTSNPDIVLKVLKLYTVESQYCSAVYK